MQKESLTNISEIDITNRCNYNESMKLEDFLEELTNKRLHKLIKSVESWKNSDNMGLRNSYTDYTKYLNKDIQDVPINELKSMFGTIYRDNNNIMYTYNSCCR